LFLCCEVEAFFFLSERKHEEWGRGEGGEMMKENALVIND